MAFAAGARAGALSPDPTGLWFDPAQPGWGLEVAQQGDIAFAVLFTYDANHRPIWYVASNLSQGTTAMSGMLYRTTGPAFSAGTFDPHAVISTAVGELQIAYGASGPSENSTLDPASPRQLALTYSIDGVQVSRTLRAQTWSAAAQDLIGAYGGHFFVTGAPDNSFLCPDPSILLTQPVQPFQPYGFSVIAGSAPNHVSVLWGSGVDLGCTADMTFQRDGQVAALAGNLQCDPIGFVPTGGGIPIVVRDLSMGQEGISGTATVQSSTPGALPCTYTGQFGGVITNAQDRSGMSPDPTGVWFNPAESGWGLILTQQGPTMFAAVFAYDTDGKPTWWVASNVTDSHTFVNFLVGEAFTGTLYGTTGAYFGSPADTTPLTATSVGTLRVANIGGTDKLALEYTVGGVTVDKTVQRQSWSNLMALGSGNYTGGLFPAASACGTSGLFAKNPTTFAIQANPGASTLRLTWPTGSGAGCVLDASYTQTGQLATISGPVQCTVVDPAQPSTGTITITEATVTSTGFSGFANFSSAGCTTGGFIGGVRR